MNKVSVTVGDSTVQVDMDFALVAKAVLEWGVDLIDVFSEPEAPESFVVVVRSSDCALLLLEGLLLGNKILALEILGEEDLITTSQIGYDPSHGLASFTFLDLPLDRKDHIVDAIRVATLLEESGASSPDSVSDMSN